MSKALGIINFAGNHIGVDGPHAYRPLGAISFLGRYRVIDFMISNLTNSGIENIDVYVRRKPRSLAEHLGTGRQYNINSKSGNLKLLFAEEDEGSIYSNDVSAYMDNMEVIEKANCSHVILAPSYMVFKQDFDVLLQQHIESNADITLLYHTTDNARDEFLNCNILDLNRQRGVLSITRNRGNAKNRSIFMDTYIMKKELFIELILKAHKASALYSFVDIVNASCDELDVRAIPHRGFFASITDFKSYYDANLALLDFKKVDAFFTDDWPFYTRTSDSCPTQYFEGASVKGSLICNGCTIEGTIENSVLGRSCDIKKGAVVKNCVILPDVVIGEDAVLENVVVDKHSRIIRIKEIKGTPEHPAYVKRADIL